MVSLGCPKNLVDSEVMMGILARQGFELTPRAEDADVLIVNTCSFIEPAQRESIDTILDVAKRGAGTTICAFYDGAVGPYISYIEKFRSEFEDLIRSDVHA